MNQRRSKSVISHNMSRIHSSSTSLEKRMFSFLNFSGLKGYHKNQRDIVGKPDFCWDQKKVAVFCDSSFWHGYKQMTTCRHNFKRNKKFWVQKISRNIERDKEVNKILRKEGWSILRFWDFEIKKDISGCIKKIAETLSQKAK